MKKGFAYRFIVLLVAFLFLASAVILSLASAGQLPSYLLWTLLGIFLGGFVLTVTINEYVIRRKKQKNENH